MYGPRVENMTGKNGNAVPNQFIIKNLPAGSFHTDEHGNLSSGAAFQSYSSVIAFRDYQGKVWLDINKWDYSRTTGKYRNQFLRETKKETEAKIKSGEYELIDLN